MQANTRVKAKKQLSFSDTAELPEILSLSVKRFENKFVDCPPELREQFDLLLNGAVFKSSNLQGVKIGHKIFLPSKKITTKIKACDQINVNGTIYELCAVVCHAGESLNSGHYTFLGKKGGLWTYKDDSQKVSGLTSVKLSEKKAQGRLFYYKKL